MLGPRTRSKAAAAPVAVQAAPKAKSSTTKAKKAAPLVEPAGTLAKNSKVAKAQEKKAAAEAKVAAAAEAAADAADEMDAARAQELEDDAAAARRLKQARDLVKALESASKKRKAASLDDNEDAWSADDLQADGAGTITGTEVVDLAGDGDGPQSGATKVRKALRKAARAQARGLSPLRSPRTRPATLFVEDEEAPAVPTSVSAAPTMLAGWPFATPLEQPDPSMSALVRTIQARTGNTLAAATRVSRAIQANQVVDLADVLRARPPTRDPLAPSQPAHVATLSAEGSWSFAQPVAQSALVQPRTIPNAAALVIAAQALANLSHWPAEVTAAHTSVLAQLAGETTQGLRLAVAYDLHVRHLVTLRVAAATSTGPSIDRILKSVIGVLPLPNLHARAQAEEDVAPFLLMPSASSSSAVSPTPAVRSPTASPAPAARNATRMPRLEFQDGWAYRVHDGKEVCLRYNHLVKAACDCPRAHVCARCGAHHPALKHPKDKGQ